MKSFFLPNTNWSFEESHEGQTWYIEIYDNAKLIVKAQASNKRLALERAWDMLSDYCRHLRRPTVACSGQAGTVAREGTGEQHGCSGRLSSSATLIL